MAYDWKTNSNEKIGKVKLHCRECKVTVLHVSFENFFCGKSPKIQFSNKGQGLIVFESDPGAIFKGFSEI